jgi:predicted nucleic acid-binding protein
MLKWSKLQQSGFLEWIINSGVYILPVTQEDLPEILRLTKKYSNLPMDFADATLVVAAEKTGIREIISIDSDFDVYRLPGKEKIHNIFNRY